VNTSRSAIERELIAVLSETARIDAASVTPQSDLAQLGIDSLKIVELIFDIEDRYGITVDYNANDGAVESVGALVDLVVGLIAAKSEAGALLSGA